MEPIQALISEIHETFVRPSTSPIEVSTSLYRDIQINFSDGSIQYSSLLLSFLEPVIKEIIAESLSDETVVIYPDRSIDCFKNLPKLHEEGLFVSEEDQIEEEGGANVKIGQCSICGKEYPSLKKLRRHFYHKHYYSNNNSNSSEVQTIGEGDNNTKKARKPGEIGRIPCPESHCKQTFARIQEINRHIATVHNPDIRTRFYCNFCSSSFNRKDNLLRHVSKIHPHELL